MKLKETYVCYESVIHVSYSLATLVVKLLLLAVSGYPLPIPDKDGKQTPDVRGLDTNSILNLKQIHHQVTHSTSVFGTEHGIILEQQVRFREGIFLFLLPLHH